MNLKLKLKLNNRRKRKITTMMNKMQRISQTFNTIRKGKLLQITN